MDNPPKPHFDRYAQSYRDMHEQSVRLSGEDPAYFAAGKIAHMADVIGEARSGNPLDILDFGCGIGGSISHLLQGFPRAQVRGVDPSSESIGIARAAHPGIEFGVIGEQGIPLQDLSMDIVMAACVYHHIPPHERPTWTRELKRVLKPGGHAFIFEHNPLNPVTRRVVRDCPFDDDAVLLPRRETIDLLREGGFSSIDVSYIVFFPRFLSALRPAEKLLKKLPLGAQYVAHGIA